MTAPDYEEGRYTPEPICPYCFHKHRDAWEIGNGAECCIEYDCHSCGETMILSRHVSIDYSTRKVPT